MGDMVETRRPVDTFSLRAGIPDLGVAFTVGGLLTERLQPGVVLCDALRCPAVGLKRRLSFLQATRLASTPPPPAKSQLTT